MGSDAQPHTNNPRRRASIAADAQLAAIESASVGAAGVQELLASNLGSLGHLGATLKFYLGREVLVLDGTTQPANITLGDEAADCTIYISGDDIIRILKGEVAPEKVFREGKIRIEGDMAISLKFYDLFRGT